MPPGLVFRSSSSVLWTRIGAIRVFLVLYLAGSVMQISLLTLHTLLTFAPVAASGVLHATSPAAVFRSRSHLIAALTSRTGMAANVSGTMLLVSSMLNRLSRMLEPKHR